MADGKIHPEMTITEAQLWKRLKPQFEKAGALAIRIENAANMSVPDCELIFRLTTVRAELKIAKGNLISIPKYQYAFGTKLAARVATNLFWMLAWRNSRLEGIEYVCFSFAKVREGPDDTVIIDLSKLPMTEIPDPAQWVREVLGGLKGEKL